MTCAVSQCWKSIVLWRHVLSYRVHWTIFQVRRRISTFFVDYNFLLHVNGTDLCIIKLRTRHNLCKKYVMFFVLSASDIILCFVSYFFCNKPPGWSVIIKHSHSRQIQFTMQSTLRNRFSSAVWLYPANNNMFRMLSNVTSECSLNVQSIQD